MSASNCAKVSVRSPSIRARWSGRSCACARIRSGIVAKGWSSICAAAVIGIVSLAGEGRNAALAEGGAAFLEVFAVEARVDGALGFLAQRRVDRGAAGELGGGDAQRR